MELLLLFPRSSTSLVSCSGLSSICNGSWSLLLACTLLVFRWELESFVGMYLFVFRLLVGWCGLSSTCSGSKSLLLACTCSVFRLLVGTTMYEYYSCIFGAVIYNSIQL